MITLSKKADSPNHLHYILGEVISHKLRHPPDWYIQDTLDFFFFRQHHRTNNTNGVLADRFYPGQFF